MKADGLQSNYNVNSESMGNQMRLLYGSAQRSFGNSCVAGTLAPSFPGRLEFLAAYTLRIKFEADMLNQQVIRIAIVAASVLFIRPSRAQEIQCV